MLAGRHHVWVVGFLLGLALVGCGSSEPPAATAPGANSAQYVEAVEQLLAPAGAMAAIAANRLDGRPARTSQAAGLVARAELELRELDALVLVDTGLAAQRARLVRGFRPVLRRMRVVARHLARDDSRGLEMSAPELFTAIRGLPSATSA